MTKKIILFLSIAVASGALFINVYNSIVDAPAWGHNIPESIYDARKYYDVTTPATFLRVFSPLNQLIAVVAVVLFWRTSVQIRTLLFVSLLMYVITDALTFGYFYPRIAIMFDSNLGASAMTQAWQEWSNMNWIRSLVLLVGVVCSSIATHKIYQIKSK
jgi:hypothetical protein